MAAEAVLTGYSRFHLDEESGLDALSRDLVAELRLHIAPHLNRRGVGAQTVAGKGGRVDLHSEYGRVPFRCRYLLLFCVKPAEEGGTTLLLDTVADVADTPGSAIVELLPEVLGFELTVPAAALDRDISGAETEFGFIEGQRRIKNGDWVLTTQIRTVTTSASGRRCGATSLTGPYVEPALDSSWQVITDATIDRYRTITGKPIQIQLAAGDGLLLDNLRVLHGRTQYHGERVVRSLMFSEFATPFG